MADHIPCLESVRLLNPDLPLLATPPPAMVNGDGPQQCEMKLIHQTVILVQVNPGEAFTIRRDDGQIQCITGPAQVPMMSPNGSVPPIYVPPGYVSQIIEENGYIPQYHAPHYCERDSHSPHNRAVFVHRDDRTNKTYERLQKKLKERQGAVTKDKFTSPPPSPQKNHSAPASDLTNGLCPASGGKGKLPGKSPCKDTDPEELDEDAKSLQALLSAVNKPAVTDVQARTVLLTWSPPAASETPGDGGEGNESGKPPPEPLSYEVTLSNTGKDGMYRTLYSGEDTNATLEDLRPATDYHARVQALCGWLQGTPSETVSFTTLSCEPDTPAPPRKTNGTKSALVLQWKAPCDNGSKIQNYLLQWDEGKQKRAFEQCYCGPQKQYRVTKLSPASQYSFRLAAKNDLGTSGFSEVVDLFTSCSVPAPPPAPDLVQAGVTWLCMEWQRPVGSPTEDDIFYALEMEEEGSGYGYKPKYDGDELSCTVKHLRRSMKYKFRVSAYNSEGKSNPSPVSEFSTCPDRPGAPCRPVLRGKVLPNSFTMGWESPKDDGGSEVTKYIVEMSEGTSWELVYSGAALEHVCAGLRPGCSYQTRVYCISKGGQSPLSEVLQVQTPPLPPGPCTPPRLGGRPKTREVQLRWAPPQVDGGSAVSCYSLEVAGAQGEEFRVVQQGPELDCTVTSLLPGRTYSFRLQAANEAGYGPFSECCEVTTGPGAPEPCRAPHVVCKSPTCAVVTWETPLCNGAQVSEFRLEWGAAEGSMQVCYSGAALSHEMKGMHPATVYFCRIQAVNVAGAGPFSEVALFQTPCSVPAAVSSVHALREPELGWGQRARGGEEEEKEEEEEEDCDRLSAPQFCPSSCLGLGWEPPCDHGSEITGYFIDLGDRQPITVGPVTRYIVQNLQPDTSYSPPRLECTAFSHQTLRLKWSEGPPKPTTSDPLQYQLQMEDRNGRFMSLYRGPCHMHKVQRLTESTSYTFRIQALNEAGEGPFSHLYTFTTPLSPPAPLKAPRIERLDDHCCEVSWEVAPPMKGDPITYSLQCMMGNSEFKQVYKGSATSFLVSGLQPSSEYRFRACAVRQCQRPPDLTGPYSATATLSSQRGEGAGTAASGGGAPSGACTRGAEPGWAKRGLSDEKCAFLIMILFAVLSILIAFVIQYFVIK
ncbi:hypothetical protein SKAU_G00271360 [Synaphobranchus kaupii]|uniref:Fibronectin type-III domain-containing protein n=1 Tax=Synaphobranchus kaupii TaxID=118154 RepID=A0A9Q1F0B5_SYNKA|nr:hypothetical protein SKAU_G00271360 [Synaphobranchus kaupii]